MIRLTWGHSEMRQLIMSTWLSAVTQTRCSFGLTSSQSFQNLFQSFIRCCALFRLRLQPVNASSALQGACWRRDAHLYHPALSAAFFSCIVTYSDRQTQKSTTDRKWYNFKWSVIVIFMTFQRLRSWLHRLTIATCIRRSFRQLPTRCINDDGEQCTLC